MGEEPFLPPIPAIGEVLTRKDRFIEKVTTVIKCTECQANYTRPFKPGDFTFKKLIDENCEKCHRKRKLCIEKNLNDEKIIKELGLELNKVYTFGQIATKIKIPVVMSLYDPRINPKLFD